MCTSWCLLLAASLTLPSYNAISSLGHAAQSLLERLTSPRDERHFLDEEDQHGRASNEAAQGCASAAEVREELKLQQQWEREAEQVSEMSGMLQGMTSCGRTVEVLEALNEGGGHMRRRKEIVRGDLSPRYVLPFRGEWERGERTMFPAP